MADSPAASKAVTGLGLMAYAVAVVAVILDQLSKHWVTNVYELAARGSVKVWGPFSLTWLENRGVSFGLLHSDANTMRWVLTLFALGVAIAIAWIVRKAERPLVAIAFGLMIGGAVGNAIDRVRFGAVIDFLDFQGLGFPWVFNVADSALTVGVILLLLDMLVDRPRPEQAV